MHRLFGLFFFISGFSALLFETVWFRQAGLMLGNSVWASSITVSSFMAGLAIGSAVSFRWAERIRKPLRAYAIAELVVAVSGVSLIWLFPRLTNWLVPVFRAVSEDGPWTDVIRLSVAFVLLLIPTAAMGCSLPLLARGLAAFESNFARLLGLLYGANTLGACVGALIGETIGISAFGVFGTGICAAIAASSASLLAFAVAGRLEIDSGEANPSPGKMVSLRAIPYRLTAAAFLAGAALLALEVVWLRFLVLFVHEGTLAFATVLAIVLLGIAVGGFLAAGWSRVQPEAYRYSFYIFLCAAPAAVFG